MASTRIPCTVLGGIGHDSGRRAQESASMAKACAQNAPRFSRAPTISLPTAPVAPVTMSYRASAVSACNTCTPRGRGQRTATGSVRLGPATQGPPPRSACNDRDMQSGLLTGNADLERRVRRKGNSHGERMRRSARRRPCHRRHHAAQTGGARARQRCRLGSAQRERRSRREGLGGRGKQRSAEQQLWRQH